MFLHMCVNLFTGRSGFPACITGHMTGGVYIWGGLGSALKRGRGSASRRGWADPLKIHGILRYTYGQQAGSTHPTGIHPYFNLLKMILYFLK